MKFIHFAIVFQTLIIPITVKLTHANEVGDDNKDSIIEYEQDLSYNQFNLQSRLLEDDDICANACADDILNAWRADENLQAKETEGVDPSGKSQRGFGLLARLTGSFDNNQNILSRLMNGLFKAFNRNKEDNPKYLISTNTILPLLSNYSTKVKSLTAMMRQESLKDAALSTGSTPTAIQMMYNISAVNVELVATVLDPILVDMRRYKTMDVRAVSCNLMQILTLFRDVTVPNIELMTQIIYTNSNNAEMKDRFGQYSKSSTSAAPSMTLTNAFSTEDNTCSDFLSSKTTSARLGGGLFEILLQFLYNNNVDVGPIGHVVRIILLIVIFPLTFVVSIVGIIVLILYLLASFLRTLLGAPDTTNDGFEGLILVVLFTITIGAPFFTARTILRNIFGFLEDILDPFLPDRPTSAPTVFTPYPTPPPNAPVIMKIPLSLRANEPIQPTASIQDAQQASDVVYHLSGVLESSMDTTVTVFQNENSFLNTNKGEDEEMDCEMAALKCKNEALMDVLPF